MAAALVLVPVGGSGTVPTIKGSAGCGCREWCGDSKVSGIRGAGGERGICQWFSAALIILDVKASTELEMWSGLGHDPPVSTLREKCHSLLGIPLVL